MILQVILSGGINLVPRVLSYSNEVAGKHATVAVHRKTCSGLNVGTHATPMSCADVQLVKSAGKHANFVSFSEGKSPGKEPKGKVFGAGRERARA